MNIADVLAETSVASLDLSRFVEVPPASPVCEAVGQMRERQQNCAFVVEYGRLQGIFTERDVLHRVVGRPGTWERPIEDEMTKSVRTMGDTQSVGEGLDIMIDWWVRNVPVVDASGDVVGNLSFYTLMKTIADLLASKIEDATPGAGLEQELEFVDFTGLNIHQPVTVGAGESVDVAAHHMRARGIGSVLVMDDRGALQGLISEFDLLMKVGCETADLSSVSVRDVMTPDPITLSARSSVATAIQQMAERGFNHVPLEGESGRPVGVISFRDIAAFLEASLLAMS